MNKRDKLLAFVLFFGGLGYLYLGIESDNGLVIGCSVLIVLGTIVWAVDEWRAE